MAKVTALTTKSRTTALMKRRIMYVSKGFGRTRWRWDRAGPPPPVCAFTYFQVGWALVR